MVLALKKPALGAAFFAAKAAQARGGGSPHSFNYMPPGGDRDRPYFMSGATRRDYLNAITTDPDRRASMSEWVGKSFDKLEAARIAAEWDGFWLGVGPERLAKAMAARAG